MAVCYACGERFYGENCATCGWEARYRCWLCGNDVGPHADDGAGFLASQCGSCGWYVCGRCEACGCDERRPDSLEEKLGYRERSR